MSESNRSTTGGDPGGGCRASQRLLSQWQGGYSAEIVIENREAAVTGWTFTFSAFGATATSWSGRWIDTGYTGSMPPFSSTTLNGTACS